MISKDLVSREFKYTSLQSLIEAAQYFEDHKAQVKINCLLQIGHWVFYILLAMDQQITGKGQIQTIKVKDVIIIQVILTIGLIILQLQVTITTKVKTITNQIMIIYKPQAN